MQRSLTALPLTVLGALFVSACSEPTGSARPSASKAVPVIAQAIGYEHAATRVEAVGTSQAKLSAEIYPAASGEVVAVSFAPGQYVQQGDVLVELDSRKEAIAVELARVKLEDASRLYERYSRSANSGAVVPATLDAARTAVQTARLELEQAKVALDDRSIEAVFDGHVGVTDVGPGDRVGPDTLITTLDDRGSLLVSFEVPESYIGELDVGDTIRLETWSAAMPAVTGDIVDIGSRIDPRNRTFLTRARVDNADDLLRPGMSFRISAAVTGPRYAVVPETAVLWGADGAYVWSVVDGEATRTAVKVVQRREGRVLLDGDLGADEVVVVEGTQRMRNGVAVEYSEQRLADSGKGPAGASAIGLHAAEQK
ncbi:MAG: efflux RND transporter periplasmic adaptor subunit [Gammaproteobacteria bacterium]|nr:efflux RND transporter periplasmic adaptor subunit [Gammaproteobacteria bacterium]